MTMIARKYSIFIQAAALALLLAIVGCAKPPTTYTMPPAEVESFRASIQKVAVVRGRYETFRHLDLPAKGTLAAAGRGFVAGVTVTIAAGVVSPVPGGTIIGVVLSPFGGIVGSFHGMFNAVPSAKVDAAEVAINKAADRLKDMKLGDDFLEDLLRLGRERTQVEFEYFDTLGPTSSDERPRYSSESVNGADVVLEIRPMRAGLWGVWSVNPPSTPFVEGGIRLIRVRDGKVLINDVIKCTGEERSYDEWAANDGELFADEIIRCIPRLAEKMVDDIFRVYALSRRR